MTSSAIARMNSIQAVSPLWGESIAALIAERSRVLFPPHVRDWLSSEALRRALSIPALLPDNLMELEEGQWYQLLDISNEDRLSVAWAPNRQVVTLLLEASDAAGRQGVLRDRKEEILRDLTNSLAQIDHPEIEELASFAARAAACEADGHTEAAVSLAVNVLDSALEKHQSEIHRQLNVRPKGSGRHSLTDVITKGHPGATGRERFFTSGSLLLLLATYGLHGVFESYKWPSPPDSKFNRNMLAHRVGVDTYKPHYSLHALLLTNALLRWLDIQVPR
ncbi:hypothetical protein [Streptomyces hydrogenans]|uniref:hypothetical protein n=1 Tax=Streptomyces hydrogenans TaxID=1873719 RepID=UPI0038014233